jgi:hypothetical protein
VAGVALPVHAPVHSSVTVETIMTLRELSSVLALVLGMLLVLAS